MYKLPLEKSKGPWKKGKKQNIESTGFDVEKLQDSGYVSVNNGNSKASIEETFFDDDNDLRMIQISTIESKKSGTGSATSLLKDIINFANKNNYKLVLLPDAKQFGFSLEATKTPLSQEQLVNWYTKNGFKQYKDTRYLIYDK